MTTKHPQRTRTLVHTLPSQAAVLLASTSTHALTIHSALGAYTDFPWPHLASQPEASGCPVPAAVPLYPRSSSFVFLQLAFALSLSLTLFHSYNHRQPSFPHSSILGSLNPPSSHHHSAFTPSSSRYSSPPLVIKKILSYKSTHNTPHDGRGSAPGQTLAASLGEEARCPEAGIGRGGAQARARA